MSSKYTKLEQLSHEAIFLESIIPAQEFDLIREAHDNAVFSTDKGLEVTTYLQLILRTAKDYNVLEDVMLIIGRSF